jgi:hypothetical protein
VYDTNNLVQHLVHDLTMIVNQVLHKIISIIHKPTSFKDTAFINVLKGRLSSWDLKTCVPQTPWSVTVDSSPGQHTGRLNDKEDITVIRLHMSC